METKSLTVGDSFQGPRNGGEKTSIRLHLDILGGQDTFVLQN